MIDLEDAIDAIDFYVDVAIDNFPEQFSEFYYKRYDSVELTDNYVFISGKDYDGYSVCAEIPRQELEKLAKQLSDLNEFEQKIHKQET